MGFYKCKSSEMPGKKFGRLLVISTEKVGGRIFCRCKYAHDKGAIFSVQE